MHKPSVNSYNVFSVWRTEIQATIREFIIYPIHKENTQYILQGLCCCSSD